jgi:hypothetical protein
MDRDGWAMTFKVVYASTVRTTPIRKSKPGRRDDDDAGVENAAVLTVVVMTSETDTRLPLSERMEQSIPTPGPAVKGVRSIGYVMNIHGQRRGGRNVLLGFSSCLLIDVVYMHLFILCDVSCRAHVRTSYPLVNESSLPFGTSQS